MRLESLNQGMNPSCISPELEKLHSIKRLEQSFLGVFALVVACGIPDNGQVSRILFRPFIWLVELRWRCKWGIASLWI